MGAGKRPRVVGVEEHQTTHTSTLPHTVGQTVLVCEEATYEDHPTSAVETCIDTETTIVPASVEQCDVIDLYSMENNERNLRRNQHCTPFLQFTSFLGPHGKIVRVQALFDEGAMTSVMCKSVFERVKHHLGNWSPSTKRLRMANGAVVQSEAV
jgi:hypothetical protein